MVLAVVAVNIEIYSYYGEFMYEKGNYRIPVAYFVGGFSSLLVSAVE